MNKNTNEKSYRVSYYPEKGSQCKYRCMYKTVRAKTEIGALRKFKQLTGIKGVCAKYVPTAAEKRAAAAAQKAAGKNVRGGDYWDGRMWCFEYDGARGGC